MKTTFSVLMSATIRVALPLAAGAMAAPALAQGDSLGCGTVAFPFAAITRPTDCANTAADLSQAVSHDRIVLTSNCGGKIYCKGGTAQTGLVPLEGTNLDACIFQLTPDIDSGSDFCLLFDTRAIWDPYEDRFWIVTPERGEIHHENGNWENQGRLHIAVSSSGTASNFTTGTWTKYTHGGVQEAINVSALPNGLPSLTNGFPDRPSIMVDDTYLYVTMKEADSGYPDNMPPDPTRFWDCRSLMLVLKKTELIAGNSESSVVVTSQFIDSAGAGGTWGHELAVEQAAYVGSEHKVYMVTLPGVYDYAALGHSINGQLFTSIDLGAFEYTNGQWVYSHTAISLSAAQRFRGAYGLIAPGGGNDGDLNAIYGLFFSAAIRDVGGTRKIYTIHEARPDSDIDTDGLIQYYVISPNGYPGGTPTKTVGKFNPTYGWAHDPSIAVNACGDIAIAYTRSGRDNSNNPIYPEFWRWLIPIGGGSTKMRIQAGPSQYLEAQPWVDYNQMSADPSDPTQFFAFHILVHNDGVGVSSTQWDGWLAKMTISGCAGRPGGGGDHAPADLWAMIEFLNAAHAGESSADLDADGEITVLDYVAALDEQHSGD